MLIIPMLRNLKQEDCHKFKTGLGYIARFCHTKMEKKKISRPIIPSLLILHKIQGSLYYCKVLHRFHLLGKWLQNVSRATAYIGKKVHSCSPYLHSWYGLQANAPHFHLAPTPFHAPTIPSRQESQIACPQSMHYELPIGHVMYITSLFLLNV